MNKGLFSPRAVVEGGDSIYYWFVNAIKVNNKRVKSLPYGKFI